MKWNETLGISNPLTTGRRRSSILLLSLSLGSSTVGAAVPPVSEGSVLSHHPGDGCSGYAGTLVPPLTITYQPWLTRFWQSGQQLRGIRFPSPSSCISWGSVSGAGGREDTLAQDKEEEAACYGFPSWTKSKMDKQQHRAWACLTFSKFYQNYSSGFPLTQFFTKFPEVPHWASSFFHTFSPATPPPFLVFLSLCLVYRWFVLHSNLKYECDNAILHSGANGSYLIKDNWASNYIINMASFFFSLEASLQLLSLLQILPLPFLACVTVNKSLLLFLHSNERNIIKS